jgi:hypothetical protein
MYFDINTSRARKTFKRLLGHANHYLITILVGLDHIQKNEVPLHEDFKTSWNPRDKNSSAIRSREFSINATLSWAIDALDAYLSLCHKKPTLYQEKNLSDKAGGAERSVNAKFLVLKEYIIPSPEDTFNLVSSLIEVAIQWRNNLVHYFADNVISEETRILLKNNPEYFIDNFQGLNISDLLNRFDSKQTPRFKEITAIIRAIQNFVETADGVLLNKINKEIHFIDCLDYHLKLNTNTESELKSKTALLYNLPAERRLKSLHQTIMNYGFSLTDKPTTIKEQWLNNLTDFKLNQALSLLKELDSNEKKTILIASK